MKNTNKEDMDPKEREQLERDLARLMARAMAMKEKRCKGFSRMSVEKAFEICARRWI